MSVATTPHLLCKGVYIDIDKGFYSIIHQIKCMALGDVCVVVFLVYRISSVLCGACCCQRQMMEWEWCLCLSGVVQWSIWRCCAVVDSGCVRNTCEIQPCSRCHVGMLHNAMPHCPCMTGMKYGLNVKTRFDENTGLWHCGRMLVSLWLAGVPLWRMRLFSMLWNGFSLALAEFSKVLHNFLCGFTLCWIEFTMFV